MNNDHTSLNGAESEAALLELFCAIIFTAFSSAGFIAGIGKLAIPCLAVALICWGLVFCTLMKFFGMKLFGLSVDTMKLVNIKKHTHRRYLNVPKHLS